MKIGLSPVDRLIQALEGQRAVYAALLTLYQENKNNIEEANIVALSDLLIEEQRQINEINRLELLRLRAISQIARQHDMPGDQLTLSRLSELLQAEPNKQMQVMEISTRIKNDIEVIEKVREPIIPLLESALRLIKRSDSARVARDKGPYRATDRSAATGDKGRTVFLDKKV